MQAARELAQLAGGGREVLDRLVEQLGGDRRVVRACGAPAAGSARGRRGAAARRRGGRARAGAARRRRRSTIRVPRRAAPPRPLALGDVAQVADEDRAARCAIRVIVSSHGNSSPSRRSAVISTRWSRTRARPPRGSGRALRDGGGAATAARSAPPSRGLPRLSARIAERALRGRVEVDHAGRDGPSSRCSRARRTGARDSAPGRSASTQLSSSDRARAYPARAASREGALRAPRRTSSALARRTRGRRCGAASASKSALSRVDVMTTAGASCAGDLLGDRRSPVVSGSCRSSSTRSGSRRRAASTPDGAVGGLADDLEAVGFEHAAARASGTRCGRRRSGPWWPSEAPLWSLEGDR